MMEWPLEADRQWQIYVTTCVLYCPLPPSLPTYQQTPFCPPQCRHVSQSHPCRGLLGVTLRHIRPLRRLQTLPVLNIFPQHELCLWRLLQKRIQKPGQNSQIWRKFRL